jgi:hypothetical protein
MIMPVILIVLSVAALTLFVSMARGRRVAVRSLDDLRGRTRPVDIESFRNLIDPAEEEYLRSNLSAKTFRMVQRERLRATLEYVQAASQNSAVLLRLGEAARHSPDPKVALAGDQLVSGAIRLRMFALMAVPKLYVGILLPSARLSPNRLVEGYQQLSGLAGQLALMQNPARTPRMSLVL